ncbi:acyl-CoA thioesterase [Burkholderia ambifaria]|uniref:acyl-CoA thioesterase n=1 Tax=Burkholderia ambifaria TaxID=152480 RepID=UPI0015886690|nr:thioesterase family protein [Burkholderia ambifaria]MBR8343530.1 hypothetical protein [Burkholderia ambifaria]
MKTFLYKRRLHHHETDADGVCHASNYLRLFEEALCNAFCSLNRPPEHLPHNIAIAEVNVIYQRPLCYGDRFEVALAFATIRRAKLGVEAVVSLNGNVCTEISCTLAAIDRTTKTSVSFDRDLHQALLNAVALNRAADVEPVTEPRHGK